MTSVSQSHAKYFFDSLNAVPSELYGIHLAVLFALQNSYICCSIKDVGIYQVRFIKILDCPHWRRCHFWLDILKCSSYFFRPKETSLLRKHYVQRERHVMKTSAEALVSSANPQIFAKFCSVCAAWSLLYGLDFALVY